jgi:asparagine N-glycosylation enzyme membrane subunit Stt3
MQLVLPIPSSDTNYQAQHPPLYYRLVAPLYGWTSDLSLDWQNFILSLFSLLLAALAIPAIYLIFEQVFGTRGGVLAALLVIWLPNYMPFLGRITNDCLSFPLISWSIYLLVRRDRHIRHQIVASILHYRFARNLY